MRAAVLRGAEDLVVTEAPDPGRPGPGWVAVRPAVVGLCGSDLHHFHGDGGQEAYPRILGHEFSGVVEELGPGVDRPELAPGARVVVWPLESCGRCPSCRTGRENACYELVITGVHRDGALAERILMPAERVFATSAAPDVAAFIEPLSVAVHALAIAGVDRDSRAEGLTAVVVGAGPIGQAAVLALTEWGARVAVVDPAEQRRQLALRLGAETGLWAEADALVELARDWADGYGADIVVDCTGAAGALDGSIAMARKTGTVLVLGLTSARASISPGALPHNELRVQGASCARRQDFESAIVLAQSRADDIAQLLTHRFPLDRAGEAFATAAAAAPDVLKVLVTL